MPEPSTIPIETDPHLEFTRHFVAHQAAFQGYLLSLVHDRHATDDLVQELAVRLWKNFGAYDRARPFVSWGLGFARLLAFEWHRQQVRLPIPVDEVTLQALAESAAERALTHDDRRDALRGCVGQLTDLQQRVLHDRYQGEQSVAEIAHRSNRTEMAVYKVLKRVHEALLDCILRALATEPQTISGP